MKVTLDFDVTKKVCGCVSVILLLIGCDTNSAPAGGEKSALEKQVVALIDNLAVSPEKQKIAVEQLQVLGATSIPYVVKHMDSRRRLPVRELTLKNFAPSAFEHSRSYQPELVVDAVDAILTQKTGQSFGYIFNGADNYARASVVSRWRAWCKTTYPSVKDGCE